MNSEKGRVNIPEKKNWGAIIFVILMLLGMVALYITLDNSEETSVKQDNTEQTAPAPASQ